MPHGEHGEGHAEIDQTDVDKSEDYGAQQELNLRNQIVPNQIFAHRNDDVVAVPAAMRSSVACPGLDLIFLTS